jgi:hypothetical protein
MNQLRYDFGGSSLIDRGRAPLLERADHSAPSVFRPENMLRESRRQKGLRSGDVPAVCVLDPDGDIVDHVRKQYGATRSALWACYHTRLWERECGGTATASWVMPSAPHLPSWWRSNCLPRGAGC